MLLSQSWAHTAMQIGWVLFLGLNRYTTNGLKIATITRPILEPAECPLVDFGFVTTDSAVNCPFPVFGKSISLPFTATETETAVFTFLDRSIVRSDVRKLTVTQAASKWRILLLIGELSDDDADEIATEWRMDAVLTSHSVPASLNSVPVCADDVCVHDTGEFELHGLRNIQYAAGSCPQPVESVTHSVVRLLPARNIPFSVEVRDIVGIRFCVVGIDALSAHFDAQLEWLQATLSEAPCRLSNWQVVFISNGMADSQVATLIDNHALVDLVIGRSSGKTPSISDQGTVQFSGTSMSLSHDCNEASNTVFVESKRSDRAQQYPSKNAMSTTPVKDIVWAFLLAVFSGLAVNVSLRKSLLMKTYEPISLA